MELFNIEALQEEDLSSFMNYLRIHVSENGGDHVLFQPLTAEQSKLGPEWEEKFKAGFRKRFGEVGWRKLWVARNEAQQIVGHIDIRSRPELNTSHRVLLGMGTDSKFRKMKVGQQLLEVVIDYCKGRSEISWLDLDVLANNVPAVKLYEKFEFKILSEIQDMFRIEGETYGYRSMTLNVD